MAEKTILPGNFKITQYPHSLHPLAMNRIETTASQCLNDDQQLLHTAACQAALTAGSIIKELYNKPHTIRMKGVINLVTEADLAAEAAIFASLEEDCPGIPIMAEESAGDNLEKSEGRIWIVDPLDGTTNFAHGFPWFAVSIALLDNGIPIVGVIYAPMQDELFCAVRHAGAWLNGQPIKVSDTSFLIESLIATGLPYDLHRALPRIMKQLETVIPKVRDIRRPGAAALDLASVACGRFDGFYEQDLHPWDTAAGWLLVEEAGGMVSDYSCNTYSPFLPEIMATNSKLHSLLSKLL